jgi:hypothetical protein
MLIETLVSRKLVSLLQFKPPPQSYSNQKPASTSSLHAHSESGSSKQDLAASAAAALAGAVSRTKSNQQSPTLAHHQPVFADHKHGKCAF